ncbi:MAG: hypothetical protein P1P84_24900 [Deferrisomatales bacterium]|nr:hypothetical protein [Deferrisomatales bacterium]
MFNAAERALRANLFEYTGSEENFRRQFSLDRLGPALDDVLLSW